MPTWLATIVNSLIVYVVRPLLIDGVKALFKWIKNKIFRKKRNKDNDKKLKEYQNADNINDANDSFDDMP